MLRNICPRISTFSKLTSITFALCSFLALSSTFCFSGVSHFIWFASVSE
uniref:Uncharacterized protein n=1 Tax=Nelumbo nucifera TaxID=4432 RepID=A0A822XTG9_NELNU|nr:TPA_asm: hypothetical protein HUJ06_024475 [Nelumbo nucifera]